MQIVGTPGVGKMKTEKSLLTRTMSVVDPYATFQLPVLLFLHFSQFICIDYTEKWFSYISAKYIEEIQENEPLVDILISFCVFNGRQYSCNYMTIYCF